MSRFYRSGIVRAVKAAELALLIDQIAACFILATVQWIVWELWATIALPEVAAGTALGSVVFDAAGLLLFLFPILVTALASVELPSRVIITPLDVNLFTGGVGVIFLFLIHRGEPVAFTVFTVAIGLWVFIVSPFQNGMMSSLIGFTVSKEELGSRLYRVSTGMAHLERILSNEDIASVIGIGDPEDVEGARVFATDISRYELNLAIFPDRESQDAEGKTSCFLAILGYEKVGVGGDRKLSRKFFPSKFDQIESLLTKPDKELGLDMKPIAMTKEDNESFIPRSVRRYAITPSLGIVGKLKQAGEGVLASAAVMVVVILVSLLALNENILNEGEVVQLVLFALLTQVGVISLRRFRRR